MADELSSYDRVKLARDKNRPNIRRYIDTIFTNFFEQRGDRNSSDDGSIVAGIAMLKNRPVTVIGHMKGRSLDENVRCNFGMSSPEGYRKAQRVMRQAEKFGRPIITFVDTPGAYPGLEAEKHGQGEAIAHSIMEMSALKVPVISVVIGEGGSGGALALSVANSLWMLENAVYSVLSPEGFAAILWKDSERAAEASELMKLTAQDLYNFGIADRVIEEPSDGLRDDSIAFFSQLQAMLCEELDSLCKLSEQALCEQRYKKYRAVGTDKE